MSHFSSPVLNPSIPQWMVLAAATRGGRRPLGQTTPAQMPRSTRVGRVGLEPTTDGL